MAGPYVGMLLRTCFQKGPQTSYEIAARTERDDGLLNRAAPSRIPVTPALVSW